MRGVNLSLSTSTAKGGCQFYKKSTINRGENRFYGVICGHLNVVGAYKYGGHAAIKTHDHLKLT
jgi:hypothetical protein